MKLKVFSAIIGAAGLGGLAVTSFGQGSVFFDNYSATPYYPIVYFSAGGPRAGGNVSAELGYALGANQTTGFTLIPSSITAVNPILGDMIKSGGYFQGLAVIIPNYVSGPITFAIFAWTTNGGTTLANATFNNAQFPTIWTEPSIALLPNPAGVFTALPGPIVIGMPEPSTLALTGLGALASLAAFRRQRWYANSPD